MDFEFEYAKSGRAACKVCKDKVDKDALRIGTKMRVDKEKAEDGDNAAKLAHIMESTKWHHFQCFPKMRSKKWYMDNLPDASSCSGFQILRDDDQQKVSALFDFCKGFATECPEPPQLPEDPQQASAGKASSRKKRTSENISPNEEGEGTPKSGSAPAPAGFTKDQDEEFERHKAELAKRSVAQLGALLSKNDMSKSGKKEELAERIAECRVIGGAPTCPTCEKGRLKFNRQTGAYTCPGHFDDIAKRLVRCKGPGKDAAVVRPEWQDMDFPEPSVSTSQRSRASKGGAAAAAAKGDDAAKGGVQKLFKKLSGAVADQGDAAGKDAADGAATVNAAPEVALKQPDAAPQTEIVELVVPNFMEESDPPTTSVSAPTEVPRVAEAACVAVRPVVASFARPIKRSKYFM